MIKSHPIEEEFHVIDKLNDQAFSIRVTDTNKAFELSKYIIEKSRNVEYTKGLAYGLRTLGFCLVRFAKNREALLELNEAFSLLDSLQDNHGKGYIYETYGIIYRNFGDYQKSLEYLYNGLVFVKAAKDYESETLSWYHLGVTYRYMGNLEKALDYFLNSLTIAKEFKYVIPESYSLNNIGSIYFELGNYTQAIEYYSQSLSSRKLLGDKWGEAGCIDNLGLTHFKLGNFDQAREFCLQSLSIAESIGDKKGIGNSLLHLAEINNKNNLFEEANKLAFESLKVRKEIGDKKGQAEAYIFLGQLAKAPITTGGKTEQQFLNEAFLISQETKSQDLDFEINLAFYKMYKSGNQFENALRHLEFANEIREQIHSKEISQKIKALEIENKISTIRNVISNEIQQATLNSISQELHDNVCQILSLTKMQLNLIEQNLDKDQNILLHAKENLSKALTDLRDIAKGMSSDRIKLLGLYESVSQEVDRINKIDNIKVSLNIDGERVEPSNQTQLIIFRIIQECIQNIIKHANATNVNIHFFYREKSFEIVIKDDGIGFDVEKKYNSSDGMGLMNIFSRIKLVGGVVNLSSSPGSGTSVSISVPL